MPLSSRLSKGREASDWYKGTADAVYRNIDFIKMYNPDLVLILSGDHIYKMDYLDVINYHVEKKADLTIAFTPTPREGPDRFGQGLIEGQDPKGRQTRRVRREAEEKGPSIGPLSRYTSSIRRSFSRPWRRTRGKDSHEFGKDIIPSLLGNSRIFGYKHLGYWGYTRTLEEYWRTSMDLLGDRAQIDLKSWQIRTNLAHREIRDRQPTISDRPPR